MGVAAAIEDRHRKCAASLLNSLVAYRTAVLQADVVNRLPLAPMCLVWEAGVEHIAELRDLWPAPWDTNRAVAEAYGLDPDDFEHILSTFPVFARKRPAFFAYLHQRLEDWKAQA